MPGRKHGKNKGKKTWNNMIYTGFYRHFHMITASVPEQGTEKYKGLTRNILYQDDRTHSMVKLSST